MPRARPPYPPEFRQQMIDLVHNGRSPWELAREFEPSGGCGCFLGLIHFVKPKLSRYSMGLR